MSDVHNATPPAEPLGNQPEARTPEGTIKDQQIPPTEPKPEPKVEPDAKPDPAKPTEPAKDPAKPAGPPEKYEFTAPEGFEVDPAAVEKITPVFKELGLDQASAQKLFDLHSELMTEAIEAPFKQFESTREDWRKSIIADTDLGNGKDDLKPEVKATIGRAIDSLPPAIAKDFREALSLTGAGDNPAFVKAFYNLAQRMTEGTLVQGGAPSPAGQRGNGQVPSPAQALFPNLPSSR